MSLISVPPPAAMSDRPFYEEWWFLLVMALVGLILILVLVFTLLLHGHSSKYKACGTGAWLWCFRGVRAAGCIKLCSNKDTCLFSFIIKMDPVFSAFSHTQIVPLSLSRLLTWIVHRFIKLSSSYCWSWRMLLHIYTDFRSSCNIVSFPRWFRIRGTLEHLSEKRSP